MGKLCAFTGAMHDLKTAARLGAGKPSFAALLGRVKKIVQGALANADVPFQQVVGDVGVPRSSAYSPVFQTMFMLDDASFSATSPQGEEAEGADSVEVRGQHAAFRVFVAALMRSCAACLGCLAPQDHFLRSGPGGQHSHAV